MENIENHSQLGNLAKALSLAQSEIETPKKTKAVKWFDSKINKDVIKYTYADLADVIDACRVPLAKNHLAIIHQLEYLGANYILKTSLLHASGESVVTVYPLPDPSKIKAQDFGGALTYARRYSLSALIGIASEDDLDGEDAPTPEPQKTSPKTQPPPASKPTPAPKQSDLDKALDDKPLSKLDQLYIMVEKMDIDPETIKMFIAQACGYPKRSTEMLDAEIDTVIQRVKLFKK